jgi:hypothetical protein
LRRPLSFAVGTSLTELLLKQVSHHGSEGPFLFQKQKQIYLFVPVNISLFKIMTARGTQEGLRSKDSLL